MRNQPRFGHGDVVCCVVDGDAGNLRFYVNARLAASWRGVLRGPCYPYCSIAHPNGPAATLLRFWAPIAASAEESEELQRGVDEEVSDADPLPAVDGTLLEGGGQVLRVALAFGALLGRPLHVFGIRGGRPKPGLGHQHSTGVRLVGDLCGALVRPESIMYGGHSEGVSELFLWPGKKGLRGGLFEADTHTAGACTLILQAALPCALLGHHAKPVELLLRGGTNVRGSPPIDYVQLVLFPLLARFGIPQQNLSVETRLRGFYPWGKGEVLVRITPVPRLNAITMVDRGEPSEIVGVVYSGGTARRETKEAVSRVKQLLRRLFGEPIAINVSAAQEEDGAQRETSAAAATAAAPQKGSRVGAKSKKKSQGVPAKEEQRGLTCKERHALVEEARKKASGAIGIQLVVRTTTGCVIAADSLLETASSFESGSLARESAELAAKRLEEAWAAGGTVCEHTMDQLLIFMALATGTSRILCPRTSSITSLHLPTAIHFSQLLCGVKFRGLPETSERSEPCIIECDGVGFSVW